MELTRRDALAALAAGGTTLGGVAALRRAEREGDGPPVGDHETATLEAAARALYPSAVSGVSEFVGAYAAGRYRDRPEHARGVAGAVATLDEYAREWYDGAYRDLDAETRDGLLSEMGLGLVDPDPDGDDAERVRYYVVNELLYALYASPTGGRLVGIENPQGHPGGAESYRRGPR